jgi:hypothetical protein
MALDIPMPDSPGDSLIKGLGAGGDLIHKMMLNKYYGQLHPSGDVANAMYVEQLRNQYGENDPRYIEAKRAHDLALQGRESLIGYRNVLNQTAGIRATSPLGKLIAEGKGQGAIDILRGNPNTAGGGGGGSTSASSNARYKVGNQYYDDQGDETDAPSSSSNTSGGRTTEEKTAYERAINKGTSDAQARNTLIRAENLDKTRNSINVDDLTRYSGLKGTGKYLYESGQAALGRPSDEYLAHQQAVNSATLMADQMRQFYGDSIQPSAMDRLRHLANPATWYKDPKVAKAQWEQLNKILDTETQTYRDKGTSPIKLNTIDFKDGKFSLGSGNGQQQAGNAADEDNSGNEGGSYDLKAVVPQLLKINPKYTEANIRSTAKEMNTTIDDVVNQLFQRAVKRGQ